MNFRTRVVLFSAIAVAVGIAVASVLIYVLVRGELRDRIDSDLRTDAARTFADPIVRDGRLVLPRAARRADAHRAARRARGRHRDPALRTDDPAW